MQSVTIHVCREENEEKPSAKRDERDVRKVLLRHLRNIFRWRHDVDGTPDNTRALCITSYAGRTLEHVRR